MADHPAHSLASTVSLAAEELQSYLDPADHFPWELTPGEHSDVLGQIQYTMSRLGPWGRLHCAGDTPGRRKNWLTDAASMVTQACEQMVAAPFVADEVDSTPRVEAAEPALAATNFPQPMSADLLRVSRAHPDPWTP